MLARILDGLFEPGVIRRESWKNGTMQLVGLKRIRRFNQGHAVAFFRHRWPVAVEAIYYQELSGRPIALSLNATGLRDTRCSPPPTAGGRGR